MQGNAPSQIGEKPRRGRRRSHDKARAILEAAAGLFLSQGFERTSMDDIAAAAGVSKQTVYGHYKSKEGLFRAVIADRVSAYFPQHPIRHAHAQPLAEMLETMGRQYMRLILSAEAAAMFRILAANASSHPKMVALFFEEGPARLMQAIEEPIRRAAKTGLIDCPDPAEGCATFCTLLRGDLFLQAVLGLLGPVDEALITDHVARSVRQFLAIYPPRTAR
ncbi:MAG: TetR family transcriptional regulator [Alphaproteobacteria bacterium]|nr:MAG: TetR family transcriptional regulator [Alphaproteobacteria bacterium]